MLKYIALYQKPDDPETFEKRYFGSHVPLVEQTPGLLRAEIARVTRVYVPGFLGEETEPYLIAELYFESAESAKAAFKTPEWQASGANLVEIGGMALVAMFMAEVLE
ncbi:MAG TPA: EthD family reductase [Pseudonocardiaceae bacterium]|nr:EthD family reductase [Pseudonocardiaceae bacterium]